MKAITIKPNGIWKGLTVSKDPYPHLNLGNLLINKNVEIKLPKDLDQSSFFSYDLDDKGQGCVFDVKIKRPENDTVQLITESYYIMKGNESFLKTIKKSKDKTALVLIDVPPKSGGNNQYSIASRIGGNKITEFENLDPDASLAEIIEIGKMPLGEKILFLIEPKTLIKIVRLGEKKDLGPESILSYWDGQNTHTSFLDGQEPHVKELLAIADETRIRTQISENLSPN